MEPIIIWGAGGHAKVVAQTVRRLQRWQLLGFVDDVTPERRGENFFGAKVLGGREAMLAYGSKSGIAIAIAFGNNTARLRIWQEMSERGFCFPALIDPAACVADDVTIGAGSYMAAGSIVQPGASLGAQVIVNTGAIIEHDCLVGDGVHVCPRACLCGHVTVGQAAWIGAGALVRDRATIGANAFIGIGALVLGDVAGEMLAFGHPARSIRKLQA